MTVTSYSPAAASITPSSADGAAFDFDENDGNDIQALVKDQNGNPMADQVVRYAWTVTPFEATTGYPKTLDEASSTTGTDGKADIAFPTGQPDGTYNLHTYINQDGTPGQQSGDLGGTDLTVKAGDADIVWEDGSVAQAQVEHHQDVRRLARACRRHRSSGSRHVDQPGADQRRQR